MVTESDLSLIHRYLADQTTKEEAAQIARRRKEDAAFNKAYKDLVEVYKKSAPLQPVKAFDAEQGWDQLSQAMTPAKVVRFPRRTAMAVMAVAAVLLAFFLLREEPVIWLETEVGPLATKTVALPDGSEVILNAGTTLQWPERFGERREVRLSGQAFFSVRRDEAAFVVNTEQGSVEVLGTAFDVWAREGKMRVTVKEGRVALSSPDGRRLELGAGEAAVVLGDAAPQSIAATTPDAWVEGGLVFERTTLSDAVADMTARFDVPIRLDAPGNLTLTGRFEDDVTSVLEEIALTLGLEVAREGETFVLREAGQ